MPTKYRKEQLKNTKEIDPKHKTSDTNLPCHSLRPTLFTLNSALFTSSVVASLRK